MYKKKFVFAFVSVVLTVVAATAGNHEHKAVASGANPLVEEMIILDGVFREVVSAVALGDSERVHKALHSMHGTMEKTHEGVHHGTVKIPKNSHRVKEFVKMDKQFHHELEALAHAAHKNDTKKMTALTQKLLAGCVSCHKTFR
ncbi:MAG: hypothetical protein EPN22_08510 [Nitrospirae bacterium]|nr:MAG: hypothetical protein EPN22_08510 [Nitrospirota bacterium]